MQDPSVSIVATGVANIASVFAALCRLGVEPNLTDSPDDIIRSEHVILPGVGAFGAGMEGLRRTGLASALQERFESGSPILGICLGMQLFCEESEEDPGVEGLGCVKGKVTRFASDLRVPQIGWNKVTAAENMRFLETGHAYFANSFRLSKIPHPWIPAMAEYGSSYVAAAEFGPTLLCQFHPELSGAWGMKLLQRWLETSKRDA